MASPERPRAACIDVGSNGIRCVAAERQGAAPPRILWQDRAAVRLGTSVFRDGAIDAPSMDAAVAALQAFRARLAGLEPIRLRAVATSAVRDARNREAFLRRARDEAGLGVEAISGDEEARLVHVAVAQRVPMGGVPWLLVDVGAGSVQVSLVQEERMLWTESRRAGGLRPAADALRLPPAGTVGGVAATGGSVEALADLLGGSDAVAVADLARLLDEMQGMTADGRARRWGLAPDRADVIVPAGRTCLEVARLAGATEVRVPRVSLRDGVLAELLRGA